jgi:N-methylhydantoinase A
MHDIEEVVHGHPAGINAILSRDGANTALIATEGHRDLLDIGRMDREFGPRFYDPTWLRPHQERPIVARRDRYGVTERIAWDGSVSVALNEEWLRGIAADIRERGTESVAICFVSAYLNREHGEVLAVDGGWTAGKSF